MCIKLDFLFGKWYKFEVFLYLLFGFVVYNDIIFLYFIFMRLNNKGDLNKFYNGIFYDGYF